MAELAHHPGRSALLHNPAPPAVLIVTFFQLRDCERADRLQLAEFKRVQAAGILKPKLHASAPQTWPCVHTLFGCMFVSLIITSSAVRKITFPSEIDWERVNSVIQND